jgi:hypothetical protein
MALPDQRIRIMAGTPIDAGDYRLLPSVLVNTVDMKAETGRFQMLKLRPVSVVVQGPEGSRWHEIPNQTGQALSIMAAIAGGITIAGILLIAVVNLVRRVRR